MNTKTVIIIDDEPAARQNLKDVIEGFDDLTIIGEASDGKSAIEQIIIKRPDLVFLDIEMPELNGFDVAKATQDINYQLIFMTAYEHYALKAFDTKAIDYLVKPARPELIVKSINKITTQHTHYHAHKSTERLILSDHAAQKVIEFDHINYIESIGRYRRVHLTQSGTHMHNTATIISEKTLDGFEAQLPDSQFYRLHRSYIINAKRLIELRYQARKHFVRLAGTDTDIPVSRSFVSILKARIAHHD
ncbi:LytR/AlgR family response regulator transcription factor [Pseudoalteromonas umbrosa]|uniref:LytR/AlgR family response regulator transcription factor n=1 Tax=Pseudoalteromonas umbrosa TaxID=3048489 RepID=UPI0024C2226C|nr:LytTR family DNA-binding domain-containing protein [Pseudoalteromonas sp. B95]MDK1289850.1 LytTR family DNA-binding domain-containing protein [Pseudoalteromonas sp. B95]